MLLLMMIIMLSLKEVRWTKMFISQNKVLYSGKYHVDVSKGARGSETLKLGWGGGGSELIIKQG